jgi:hypothetical protein
VPAELAMPTAIGDEEWERALADLRCALVPGGRLVFDSRDPESRRWERWNPVDSRRRLRLPDGGEIEVWTEVVAAKNNVVTFTHHYVFPDEELLSTSSLRFRTEGELRTGLQDAGFSVEQIYGGWAGQPVGAGDGEFLVIARAVADGYHYHRRSATLRG